MSFNQTARDKAYFTSRAWTFDLLLETISTRRK